MDDTEFEVLWLEDEQIPALVRQRYAKREVVLRLREIYPLQQAPWPRAKTRGYQRIDYADLGDKSSDPWVRRIQQGDLPTSWLLHHHGDRWRCNPVGPAGGMRAASDPGRGQSGYHGQCRNAACHDAMYCCMRWQKREDFSANIR